jgi:hypothetical protein
MINLFVLQSTKSFLKICTKKCHDINSLVKNLYTVKASGSGESFEQTTITTERGLSPVNEDHLKRKLA